MTLKTVCHKFLNLIAECSRPDPTKEIETIFVMLLMTDDLREIAGQGDEPIMTTICFGQDWYGTLQPLRQQRSGPLVVHKDDLSRRTERASKPLHRTVELAN